MELRRHGIQRSIHGKTVRVCVTISEGRIVNAVFTGDFFGEPVEAFQELSRVLAGLKITENEKIDEVIDKFFEEKVTWLAGASPEDFKLALIKAIEGAG
ncbi:MAG: hypothetical protein N3F65_05440 [Nitrososphaeria archaeon]|nr:hypothetical protein [Nitrososphaeria archaeon]MDW8021618.1 lipoate protein ligase C-terminal domain-containing protein [Nitrososphaerota archaeon]